MLSLSLLQGCGGPGYHVSILKEQASQRPQLNIQRPVMPAFEKVKWHVVTKNNSDKVFDRLERNYSDPLIIGLTDEHYKKLNRILIKVKSHIKELNIVINQYQAYYEGQNQTYTNNNNAARTNGSSGSFRR